MQAVVNSITTKVKQLFPVSVRARAHYWLSNYHDDRFDRYQGKPKVIVALAADYGNLGDVAITSAQEMYLKSCLPDHEIVDFPISSTFTRLRALKQVVTSDDIVTITGGGNMGDLHHSIEDCRRFVIHNFPKNKIVSFPETIDFSNGLTGLRELKKSIDVYGKHGNLHLFARERVSFDMMKKIFPRNRVYCVPDIVLTLDKSEPRHERHGIVLCIRNDNESAISIEDRTGFLNRLSSAMPNFAETDTQIGRDGLTLREREDELLKILDCFKRAEVVVTDRLHGMIFAAITGTPCVALQSKNHKIKGTYDAWLSALGHIRLQANFSVEETIRTVTELQKAGQARVQPPNLAAYYETLRSVVIGQYK